ncbi:DUF4330 family protein [Aedoeadaptatus pacaensis]|uniref:DUF4330 family protein n=1 Tax=Aedoeadaptatus pacaensis TaxID=1776390 RepID=UPI00083864AF|nr:DUF4330 family protein [Peptoniphilus pacaensis]
MATKKLKLLDILFILLLVAFLVIIVRHKTMVQGGATGSNGIITIESDEIETASTEAIKEGDVCIDKRRNNTIGTVASYSVGKPIDNPSSEYKGTEDGRGEGNNFRSLRINVATRAKVGNDGIYINGTKCLLGEELTFTVGDLQVHGKIKNIEVENEE